MHPFPARMAPGIAVSFLSSSQKRLRVLDPMMGSGTVVALARAKGHHAIGVDIDPLAVLMTKVWTTTVDCSRARLKARQVLARAQSMNVTLRTAYPKNADDETRRFVRYWFDRHTRPQMVALATSIHRVRDNKMRDVLWCAFSRLIIAKQAGVSLAMDLAHSRPHRAFQRAPIKPFPNFLAAVDRVLQNCISTSDADRGPAPHLRGGDARNLRVPDRSIDLVLTSPPYINAIDYMRCSKFSLIWMGFTVKELRELRSRSVGSEVGQYRPANHSAKILKEFKLANRLSSRNRAVLARFIEDMSVALGEAWRVLVPGGRAVYVLGDNNLRGTYISNSRLIRVLASRAGLKFVHQQTRALPPNRRYLPPPSRNKPKDSLDVRLHREVVLSFRKPLDRKQRK